MTNPEREVQLCLHTIHCKAKLPHIWKEINPKNIRMVFSPELNEPQNRMGDVVSELYYHLFCLIFCHILLQCWMRN